MKIIIEAIRGKELDAIYSYKSQYEVSKYKMDCADSFMSRRGYPSGNSFTSENYKNYIMDFLGFKIVQTDIKDFVDIETSMPDTFKVLKAFGAEIKGSSVRTDYKQKAWILFKLFRLNRTQEGVNILKKTSELLEFTDEPLTAFIAGSLTEYLLNNNTLAITNNGALFRLYFNILPSSPKIFNIPYSQKLEDWYKVICNNLDITTSFDYMEAKSKYLNKARGSYTFTTAAVSSDTAFKKLPKSEKDRCKDFTKAVALEDWKKVVSLIQMKDYYDSDIINR
ncbi:hypothetical protein N356_gp022 [Cellulophaga phage phi14:2]|uniref:Uncharacterized protein n=1 Tax=Cellulophaga phage phi14:2 TaxID=1327990 RepID=S0A005_9CAUD|nr:hypothetical protein N356_gp022 [Cellulophaga phage phi14:2]AGO48914.1 hypothetical protein Phi14:2_gp036 [Cellulophaga phage phi14:2]